MEWILSSGKEKHSGTCLWNWAACLGGSESASSVDKVGLLDPECVDVNPASTPHQGREPGWVTRTLPLLLRLQQLEMRLTVNNWGPQCSVLLAKWRLGFSHLGKPGCVVVAVVWGAQTEGFCPLESLRGRRDKLGLWDYQIHTTIYKINKQQGCTV